MVDTQSAVHCIGETISMDHLAMAWTKMPLYSYLF
jgi:hypothetical protein